MDINIKKETTCCFTGPRPHKLSLLNDGSKYARLRICLMQKVIQKVLHEKYDTFLCGMAQGADLLFASVVLEVNETITYPVRLVCLLPHATQTKGWPANIRRQYDVILSKAHKSILLRQDYAHGCYLERNRFMVDRAACLIAVYDGKSGGGTGYTVNYARRQHLSLSLIDPSFL